MFKLFPGELVKRLNIEEELEALIGPLIIRTQMMQLMVASMVIDMIKDQR